MITDSTLRNNKRYCQTKCLSLNWRSSPSWGRVILKLVSTRCLMEHRKHLSTLVVWYKRITKQRSNTIEKQLQDQLHYAKILSKRTRSYRDLWIQNKLRPLIHEPLKRVSQEEPVIPLPHKGNQVLLKSKQPLRLTLLAGFRINHQDNSVDMILRGIINHM